MNCHGTLKHSSLSILFGIFYVISELTDDWTLKSSLKDLSVSGEDADDKDEFDIFQVKYLGQVPTESALNTKDTTAVAIKNIIAQAKSIHN